MTISLCQTWVHHPKKDGNHPKKDGNHPFLPSFWTGWGGMPSFFWEWKKELYSLLTPNMPIQPMHPASLPIFQDSKFALYPLSLGED